MAKIAAPQRPVCSGDRKFEGRSLATATSAERSSKQFSGFCYWPRLFRSCHEQRLLPNRLIGCPVGQLPPAPPNRYCTHSWVNKRLFAVDDRHQLAASDDRALQLPTQKEAYSKLTLAVGILTLRCSRTFDAVRLGDRVAAASD